MADILEGENRYALAKGDDLWHIFPATHKEPPNTGCSLLNSRNSICNKLDWNDAIEKKDHCYNEHEMREECKEIGRPICGICISHLYAEVTEEEQEILNS